MSTWTPIGELSCPLGYVHTNGHKLCKQADDKRWLLTTANGRTAVLSKRATFGVADRILQELCK